MTPADDDRVSLVASLPVRDARLTGYRSTYQVASEVIEGAESSLIVSSYSAKASAAGLLNLLADASAQGVDVVICLERSIGAPETVMELWPEGFPKPTILVRNEERWPKGNLHAKFIVADREQALISSANFTAWATDNNFEAGLLVGTRPARRLHDLVVDMQRAGILRELDASEIG